MLNFNDVAKTGIQSDQLCELGSTRKESVHSADIQAGSSPPNRAAVVTVLEEWRTAQIASSLVRDVVQPVQMVTSDVFGTVQRSQLNNSSRPDIEQPAPMAASIVREPSSFVQVHGQEIIRSRGKAYAVIRDEGNPYMLLVGSNALSSRIRDDFQKQSGKKLSKHGLEEIICDLKAHSEKLGVEVATYSRVADCPGGVIIDLGDKLRSQVRITAGKVETVVSGSEVLFHRSPLSLSMPNSVQSGKGDVMRLSKHVNLGHVEFRLLLAWLTYTLGHAKVGGTDFVFMTILGGQGSGKSLLSKISKSLVDPSVVDAQVMPKSDKDLAVATESAHVVCFDNMRHLSYSMSDALCTVSTGGALASRKLYSDADQYAINMHGAAIFNGIHAFVDQPDLAQRCLTFCLTPLAAEKRISKATMLRELEDDMPMIQRGLFDKIAQIFDHLPTARVVSRERMMGFCQWLAAMESADGVSIGTYQHKYSESLLQGQLDALLDNPLAAALLEFVESLKDDDFEDKREWSGTPSDLLRQLNFRYEGGGRRSSAWPENPIALSKRLPALLPALDSQGIRVELGLRGKDRKITVTNTSCK